MRQLLCIGILLVAGCAAAAASREPVEVTPDELRADAAGLAGLLPARAGGFGKPVTDRAAWKALSAAEAFREVIPEARELLTSPLPPTTDALYLDYSRTGNRTRWQHVARDRRGRIMTLALAECLENRGRFISALEEVLAAVCAERTWVMPAHDRSLANFKGERIDIDLGSSRVGCDLATVHYLLGERLSEKTRTLIRENVHRRIFRPYMDMLTGKQKSNWWLTGTNNWNAVCQANITATALMMIESRPERAMYVAAARKLIRNFLNGFTPDGYCSEGLGYWNYGFGHYVLLAESIRRSTSGKVDLMDDERAKAAATFAQRIEIASGVSPAFADCSVGTQAAGELVHYLRRRYGLAGGDAAALNGRSLYASLMYFTLDGSGLPSPAGKPAKPGVGVRSWFPDAGVLICRPAAGPGRRMGVALKGGHNNEHHNHNDVGSYVVALGGTAVLVDPGSEVYTARTFGSRRYDSNVLNSYGHPVPRVAGKLQRTGRQARGEVLAKKFTDEADTFVLDLRAAYGLEQVTTLRRTFVYSRKGAGALTVTDEVAFTAPEQFETALITLGRWKKLSDGALMIYDGDEAVRVDIDVAGGEFEIAAEEIREDMKTRSLPTRIAIRLKRPVAKATITVKITQRQRP